MSLITLFKSVILISVMGSIAAGIVVLIKLLFKRKLSSTWHYYIWLLVVIRLLLPYSLSSPLSIYNYVSIPTEQTKISSVTKVQQQEPTIALPDLVSNVSMLNSQSNQANVNISLLNNTSISAKQSMLWMLSAVWASISCILLIYIITQYVIFRFKLLKDSQDGASNMLDLLEQGKAKLKIKQEVSIIYSKHIRTPALVGILKPKLLIPYKLTETLTEEEEKYIILHELSHLKRKDIFLNWITIVLLAIHWFNPIIWLSFRQMKKDCEISCDALTLSNLEPKEHKQYGETLIKLIGIFSKAQWQPGTTAMVNKHEIKRRIIMISRFKKQPLLWSIISIILVTGIGFIVLTNSKGSAQAVDKPISSSKLEESQGNTPSAETKNSDTNASEASSNSNASDSKPQSTEASALLKEMFELAKKGLIPNCEFASKNSLIDNVIAKWGKADKTDAAGKGLYATYSKRGVTFGFNKGNQIFDVRSYSPNLKKIKYSDAEKTLGKPSKINHYNGDAILIYDVNSDYQLMLIFSEPNKSNTNPSLDHTSVYSPQAARNLMAEGNNSTSSKSRYDVAGINNADEFEDFFVKLQNMVANGENKKVAEYVKYPINVYIDGKKTAIKNKDEFYNNFDKIFNNDVKTAFLKQNVKETFVNYQGVMVGNGQIWFNMFDGRYYIYGINNDIN